MSSLILEMLLTCQGGCFTKGRLVGMPTLITRHTGVINLAVFIRSTLLDLFKLK